jgi:hypothetical protein
MLHGVRCMSDVAVTCEKSGSLSLMAYSANMHRKTPQSQPFVCCGHCVPSGPLLAGPRLADNRRHATDTRLQLCLMPCRTADDGSTRQTPPNKQLRSMRYEHGSVESVRWVQQPYRVHLRASIFTCDLSFASSTMYLRTH